MAWQLPRATVRFIPSRRASWWNFPFSVIVNELRSNEAGAPAILPLFFAGSFVRALQEISRGGGGGGDEDGWRRALSPTRSIDWLLLNDLPSVTSESLKRGVWYLSFSSCFPNAVSPLRTFSVSNYKSVQLVASLPNIKDSVHISNWTIAK